MGVKRIVDTILERLKVLGLGLKIGHLGRAKLKARLPWIPPRILKRIREIFFF